MWQRHVGGQSGVWPILVVCLAAGGCSPNEGEPEIEVEDVFAIDPNCDFSEPIDATLGEWLPDEPFVVLEPDVPPLPIRGPQGGQHFLLAMDLRNPAPGFPGAQVQLTASLCLEETCVDSEEWPLVASAQIDSLAGGTSWWPQDDGSVLLGSYFLVLDYWSEFDQVDHGHIEAALTDVCGRTAQLSWTGQTRSEFNTTSTSSNSASTSSE